MESIVSYVKPTQQKLFKMLLRRFPKSRIYRKGGYILVTGDAPILLVAHLDTVHKEPPKTICISSDKNILMSPQGIGGDDRCGVYALCKVWERSRKKPSLLFTCDEEIGGIGAGKFCDDWNAGKIPAALSYVKMIVEIDRKGKNDAVYYDCENDDFEKYVTGKGYKTAYGSFSDISLVAPTIGVAAVNLSSGYYNPHTQHEYIVISETENTIKTVCEMVNDALDPSFPVYEYIEYVPHWGDWGNYVTLGDDWGYPLDDWKEAKESPEKIEQMKAEIADYYGGDYLERMMQTYGEEVIPKIYYDEF